MRFFRGSKYWNAQLAGLFGAFCLVIGLKGPIAQWRLPEAVDIDGSVQRAYSLNGPSFLSAEDVVTRLSSYALLVVMIGALWALFNLRFSLLLRWALGVGAATLIVMAAGVLNLQKYHDLSGKTFVPTFLQETGVASMGWAWFPLMLAPLLILLSARLAEEPSEAERERLFGEYPPLISINLQKRQPTIGKSPAMPRTVAVAAHAGALSSQATPTASQASQTAMKSTTPPPATDVGFCEACGAKNSLLATRCHKCGETLSWEKAKQQKKAHKDQTKAVVKSQVASTGATIGANSGNIAKVIAGNFFLFVFCLSLPFFGYFIWQHLDNESSDYAGAAFWGMLIGGIMLVGGFLLRMLGTMARVGAM